MDLIFLCSICYFKKRSHVVCEQKQGSFSLGAPVAVQPRLQPLTLKPYQPSKALPPHRIPGTGTAGTTAVHQAGFCPTAGASGVSGCLGTPWPPFLSLTPRASWQQGLKLISPPKKACQEIFSQPEAYCLQQVRKCFLHHAITFVLGGAMCVAAVTAINPGIVDETGFLSYPHSLGFDKSCSELQDVS